MKPPASCSTSRSARSRPKSRRVLPRSTRWRRCQGRPRRSSSSSSPRPPSARASASRRCRASTAIRRRSAASPGARSTRRFVSRRWPGSPTRPSWSPPRCAADSATSPSARSSASRRIGPPSGASRRVAPIRPPRAGRARFCAPWKRPTPPPRPPTWPGSRPWSSRAASSGTWCTTSRGWPRRHPWPAPTRGSIASSPSGTTAPRTPMPGWPIVTRRPCRPRATRSQRHGPRARPRTALPTRSRPRLECAACSSRGCRDSPPTRPSRRRPPSSRSGIPWIPSIIPPRAI